MKIAIVGMILTIFLGLMLAGCGARSEATAETGSGSDDTLKVTFLDVGKGDCILVQKDGKNMLIDAGYEETAESVISFLKEQGVASLDYFIITHYDKDHVGGAAQVAEAFDVQQIYLPGYEGNSQYYEAFMAAIEDGDLKAEQVTEDLFLDFSGASLSIYASDVEFVPETEEEEGNDNDVSLVISLINGADSYLFAGDLEKEGVAAYLSEDHLTFDVVKMPHHGKKAGNSDGFIASVSPKIAVITDSTDDPAEEKLLALLEEAGAKTLQTSVAGTIQITSNGSGEYHAVRANGGKSAAFTFEDPKLPSAADQIYIATCEIN